MSVAVYIHSFVVTKYSALWCKDSTESSNLFSLGLNPSGATYNIMWGVAVVAHQAHTVLKDRKIFELIFF